MAAGSRSPAGPRAAVPWRFLVAAGLAGCLLRAAFGLGYWTGQPLTRDEQEYLSLARSLAAGHGFTYDEALRDGSFVPFGRAPGYPFFLAMTGGGSAPVTEVPAAVTIAQSIAGGIGVLLAGLLAGRLAGATAALVAAALAAVYPPLVWIAAYALSEAIFWPIALALALLFDRAIARGEDGRRAAIVGALCGLVCGLGVLVRPALLLFLPIAGLLLLARREWRVLAALALGAVVVLGPWTARNYRVHGRLMIVASDGGVTFWTGNHPLAIGEGDMAANQAIKRDDLRLRAEHPGLSEEAMEPIYYKEALDWIRAHPGRWIVLEVKKLFYSFVPIGPSYTLHSRLYYGTTLVSYLPLLALGLVGAVRLGRRLNAAIGLWILVGASVATNLIFFPQERFRIPVIDPALVVLASAAVAAWLDRARPSPAR